MTLNEFIEGNNLFLFATLFILGVTILFCLLRAFLGPRFTDRVLAINMINVKTVILACVIGIIIEEEYVTDIAIVYSPFLFGCISYCFITAKSIDIKSVTVINFECCA